MKMSLYQKTVRETNRVYAKLVQSGVSPEAALEITEAANQAALRIQKSKVE